MNRYYYYCSKCGWAKSFTTKEECKAEKWHHKTRGCILNPVRPIDGKPVYLRSPRPLEKIGEPPEFWDVEANIEEPNDGEGRES